ncbi:heat shock 70 kDa protein 1 [Trichonephila clavata]|uniref:Heat shock 70 kDa protein 1 n=1 Tax=Trichonephila clavata TaxID=2740835 RepID=A0A8X6GDJ1_TRICU|nr:heat shock 70 kDa protein 1 [Trichonephila clavata]
MDLFRSTLQPVERALTDAKLDKSSIYDVVLVGGSTRTPKIQKLLRDFFNEKELCMPINPDEAVAYGAAVQATILTGRTDEKIKDVLLADVAVVSLATDKSSGDSRSIRITNDKGQLSKEDIERILNEAKPYESEGQEQREKVAGRSSLQSYVYSVKQAAESDSDDRLSSSDKAKVKQICDGITQ